MLPSSTSEIENNNGWSSQFGQTVSNVSYPMMDQLKWNHKMATSKNGISVGHGSSFGIGWNGHFSGRNVETGTSYFVFGQGLWAPDKTNCKSNCETFPMCGCKSNTFFMKQQKCEKGRQTGQLRFSMETKASVVVVAKEMKLKSLQRKHQESRNYQGDWENYYGWPQPQQSRFSNPWPCPTSQYYGLMAPYAGFANNKEPNAKFFDHNRNEFSNGCVPQSQSQLQVYHPDNWEYNSWSGWEQSNQWNRNQFYSENEFVYNTDTHMQNMMKYYNNQ